MKSWLVQLTESGKTDEQILAEAIDTLPPSELSKLAFDLGLDSRPTQVEDMQTKIAAAQRMGIELAHERADIELEKDAFLPVLGGLAARALGGTALKGAVGGMAKNVAKDMAVGAVSNKLTGALKPQGQMAAAPMQGGGFKYAGVMGQIGRQAAGFAHRNPGAALTLGGAAVGAMMAPRDPQTGEKQYMRGALMGGGLAAGANALSKGRIADKGLKMVTRQNNPVLGQDARRFMIESAHKTRPGAVPVASEAGAAVQGLKDMHAGHGPVAAAAPAAKPISPEWQQAHAGAQGMQEATRLQQDMSGLQQRNQGMLGRAGNWIQDKIHGPMTNGFRPPQSAAVKVASVADLIAEMALEKFANRSTLTYDPATKTFQRHHVTDSPGEGPLPAIEAGASHPMMAHEGPVAPSQAARPAGIPGKVHSYEGGNVMSSSPHPRNVPPPVPAAAMKPKMPMGGVAGMAGAAIKPVMGKPGIAGALAGGLKKIARKK